MALKIALDACHPVGVEKATCSRPVEQGNRIAEADRTVLGAFGRANGLDGTANATAFSPILEPGPGAQLHSLLGTLDIRHCFALWSGFYREFVSTES